MAQGIKPRNAIEKSVLAFCNTVRKAMGNPPRKTIARGIPNSECGCAIANTVGHGAVVPVGAGCAGCCVDTLDDDGCFDWDYYEEHFQSFILPGDVKDWMEEFDKGNFFLFIEKEGCCDSLITSALNEAGP